MNFSTCLIYFFFCTQSDNNRAPLRPDAKQITDIHLHRPGYAATHLTRQINRVDIFERLRPLPSVLLRRTPTSFYELHFS